MKNKKQLDLFNQENQGNQLEKSVKKEEIAANLIDINIIQERRYLSDYPDFIKRALLKAGITEVKVKGGKKPTENTPKKYLLKYAQRILKKYGHNTEPKHYGG